MSKQKYAPIRKLHVTRNCLLTRGNKVKREQSQSTWITNWTDDYGIISTNDY